MISIIVPVYNTAQYLRECIDSVIHQTFTDWELVIVDDGSTDRSPTICDEYAAADARIKVIHIENSGQANARNIGIDASQGEYITFLDSDDKLSPLYLEIMMEIEMKAGGDNIVCVNFSHNDKKLCRRHNRFAITYYNPDEAITRSLYQKSLEPNVWARLCPRRIFDKVRFRKGLYYEDLEIFYRLIEECGTTVAETRLPLYYYRSNPASFINTWSDRRLDVLRVTAELVERYGTAAARSRRLSANYNMYLLAIKNKRPEVAAACMEVIKKYRWESITDPHVRLSNKIASLISLCGLLPAMGRLNSR